MKKIFTFNINTGTEEAPKIYEVSFRKPKRAEDEESALFYSSKFNQLLARGIPTTSSIQKRLLANQGETSTELIEGFQKASKELADLQLKLEELSIDLDNKESNKELVAEVIKNIVLAEQKVQEYDSAMQTPFDNTAEKFALEEKIRWFVLNMSYVREEDSQEEKPLFSGKTYEEKLASLDQKEEDEDQIYLMSIGKLFTVAMYWVLNIRDPAEIAERLKAK